MDLVSIREGDRATVTFIHQEDDALPVGPGKWMMVKCDADSFEVTTDIRYGNADCTAEQLVNHTNLYLRSLTYPDRVSGVSPHRSNEFPRPAGRQEEK